VREESVGLHCPGERTSVRTTRRAICRPDGTGLAMRKYLRLLSLVLSLTRLTSAFCCLDRSLLAQRAGHNNPHQQRVDNQPQQRRLKTDSNQENFFFSITISFLFDKSIA
jgi:hypothetical protein